MFYLRLLGGITLEEDGETLRGRAVQKRRLALLSVLAVAPLRSASRDRLLGLLWPRKEEEQARHLLSAAIYEIRKELDEGILASRGDDVVLDPAAVATDLEDFRSAMERGDLDRALALYTGPFLDGFFLGESPAFDQWMESERAAISRDFRGALERLAERQEKEGRPEEAVVTWRRLAAEDRYNSRVAIRLLSALEAVGNRGGALQFARVHEVLLQDEFETAPPAEFTALVVAMRNSTTVPRPSEAAKQVEPPSQPSEPARRVIAPPPVLGHDVPVPRDRRPVPDRNRGKRAMALLVVAILAAGAFSAWMLRPPPGPITIAVLPFEGEDEAFADGLAEAILGALGSVEGVRVTVWSAASALRGVSAAEAATRLNVDYVVGGSVRREGAAMRIRLNLSDAGGMALWEHVYDRAEGAVFQMQDDIATSVLGALPFSLQLGGIRPLVGETRDEVAYGYYLRGRHAWYRRTPDGFRQALTYFQGAVNQDSTYARAYAGLADTYNLLGAYDYGLMPPDSAFPLGRAAAERALELEPNLADAHAALAQSLFSYDRNWSAAEASFLAALRLNPRSVEAHHWYSLLLIAIDRGEEALEAAEQAVLLDSVSTITHANMGRHLYYRGDYEAAEAAFRRALTLDPGAITAHLGHGLVLMELGRADEAVVIFARVLEASGQPHAVTLALLGHALGRAGRLDEARETLVRLEGLRDAGTYVPSEYPALIHIAMGNLDLAVAGFEAAFGAHSSASAFMGVDPLATPLRAHPGFQRLLVRAGLPGGEL